MSPPPLGRGQDVYYRGPGPDVSDSAYLVLSLLFLLLLCCYAAALLAGSCLVDDGGPSRPTVRYRILRPIPPDRDPGGV
jgi:hypothetical protein